MARIDNFINDIKAKTGWKDVKIDNNNRFFFTIQGKDKAYIDFYIFSPDDIHLIMEVNLLELPRDDYEKNKMLNDYAKREVAACKTRPSILSVDNNNVILYNRTRFADSSKTLEAMNTFLKDVDWWLQKQDNFSSPFSFSIR